MKRKPLEKLLMALAATFVFVSPAMNSIAMAESTNASSGQTTVNADNDEQKVTGQQQQQEEQPAASDQQPKGTHDNGGDTGDSGKSNPTTGQSPMNPSAGQDPKGNPEQPRAPNQKDDDNKGTQGHVHEQKVPVTIYKYAAGTTKGLQGASFKLYQNGKTDGKTYQTSSAGTVSLGSLAPGNYTLAEIHAPTGYEITNPYTKFTVVKGATSKNVVIYNKAKETPKGSLTVTKYNENQSKKLAGATFAVYDGKQLVKSGTTTGYGTVTFTGLDIGKTYTVYETVAPQGYVKDTAPKTATITAKGGAVSFTNKLAVVEEKHGKIKIFKKDEDSGKPLAGATFAVKSGEEVKYSAATDENGVTTVSGLTVGKTYSVYETAAPEGYTKSTEVKSATATKDGAGVTFYNKKVATPAQKGKVVVYKYKEGTKTPLAGATFALTLDGQTVATKTTGTDGVITFDGLQEGKKYVVTETAAPEGYEKVSDSQTVTASKYGAYVKFYNKLKAPVPTGKGNIKVNKVDENQKPLAGATFTLSADGTVIDTKTTDRSGVITFSGLDIGKTYVVTETAAPEGYEGTGPQTVSFTAQATAKGMSGGSKDITKYLTFVNKKIKSATGELTIVKKDKETKKVLAGATFAVIDTVSGETVGTATTDASGKVTFKNLAVDQNYVVKEVSAPEGYKAVSAEQTVKIPAKSGHKICYYELLFFNEKIKEDKGSVGLVKVDAKDAKKKLAGASFVLLNQDMKQVRDAKVTDASGYVSFDGLAAGTYYFKEVAAPTGYVLSETPIKVVVNAKGKTTTVYAKNTAVEKGLGTVKLYKYAGDKKAKPLAGATFQLYDANYQPVSDATYTTSADGYITVSNLTVGATYFFKETAAPEGYELNTSYHKVVAAKHAMTGGVAYVSNKEVPAPTGKVTLTKVDADDKQTVLKGAVFGLYKDGVLVQTMTTNDSGQISATDLAYGNYYLQETVAPPGYELSNAKYEFVISHKMKEPNISFIAKNKKTVEKLGSAKLKKVDEKGKPLAGATFTLYNSNNDAVGQATSGEDGYVVINDVKEGDYYFMETAAPAGYEFDATAKYPVKVVAKAGSEKTFGHHHQNIQKVVNKKTVAQTGSITLTKTDGKKGLAGAVFQLYKADGTLVGEPITTGDNGVISVQNLAYGSYYFKEVTAPAGYVLDQTPIKFDINKKYAHVKQTFKNKKAHEHKGIAKIKKVDEKGKPLAGATFTLYDANGQAVGTAVSADNGYVTVSNLAYGAYYFMETAAPAGYEFDKDAKYNVKVDKYGHGKVVQVTNKKAEDKKGSISLTKMGDGKPLAGAVFQLYKADHTPVGEPVTTSESGQFAINNLAYGDYYLKELAAPVGYALDETPIPFTISDDTRNVSKEFTNKKVTPYYGSVKVKKVDQDGKPLAGAVFNIYNFEDDYVGTVTSGEDGYASMGNLPAGPYYFKEVSAPAGYEFDANAKYDVVISKDETAESTVPTVENKLIPAETGSATIIKMGDGKPLTGAVFQLYKADGTAIGSPIASDAQGIVKATDLAFGDYYFKEITAPAGYKLDDTPINFTISKTSIGFQKVFNNAKDAEPPVLGSVSLVKVDSATKTVLPNVVFDLYKDGTLYGTYTTNASGMINVADLPAGQYYFKETAPLTGYYPNTMSYAFTIDQAHVTHTVTVENTKIPPVVSKGHLQLTKIEADTSTPLAGAIFNLVDDKGNIVRSGLVTDANGQILVENLELGSYSFIETKAPAGYVLDTTPVTGKVEANKVTPVSKVNKADKGSVILTKVDSVSNAALSGAVFKVVDGAGNIVKDNLTTNASGQIVVNDLANGSYSFVETKAPDGYKLDSTPQPFTITKDQTAAAQVVMKNTLNRGSVVLTKVDDKSGQALAGAVFKLVDSAGNTLASELTTNASGQISMNELAPGTYSLIETKAPAGYVLDETPVSFTIEKNQQTALQLTKDNTLKRGTVILQKLDGRTSNALAGVTFDLQDANGNTVKANLKTGDDGRITLSDLAPGKYQFVERATLAGYDLNDTPIVFTIEENQQNPVMVAMLNFPSSDAPPEPEDPDPEDPTTPTKPTPPGTSTGTNPPSNTNTGSNTNTNNVTNNNTVTSNVPGTTKPTVTSSSTYTNPANASSGTNTENKAGLPQTGTAYAMTFGLGVVLVLFAWFMIRRSRRA